MLISSEQLVKTAKIAQKLRKYYLYENVLHLNERVLKQYKYSTSNDKQCILLTEWLQAYSKAW